MKNQVSAEPTKPATSPVSALRRLFGRRGADPLQEGADRLHDSLVGQVRRPVFYTDFRVPDTFEGRFDLLVLHVALVLRGLALHGAEGQALSQALVDTMFARFDVALRELGVSDIGVPKRMKRLAEAFKGRTAAYHDALSRSDLAGTTAAVSRNVFADRIEGTALASYALGLADRLANVPLEAYVQGQLPFPDPVPAGSHR